MMKVIITPANNGLIKTIEDDNSNGAGEVIKFTTVHELEDDDVEKVCDFLYTLTEDLGISTGNQYGNSVIEIKTTWGKKYEPKQEEINQKIKQLEEEIQLLREILNEL